MLACHLGAMLLLACAEKHPPYGGTLRIGYNGEPSIINPILTTDTVSLSLQNLLFNGLVKIGPRREMVPDLAEDWDVSEDGTVWTFRLKRGVKFHDGVECTASDVKFVYDKIMDPAIGSPCASDFRKVERIEVPDPYTFRIILKEPFGPLLYYLQVQIAPKHLLEGRPLREAPFNRHPVGTGPFRFSHRTSKEIILGAYEEHFDGRPYLDEIVVEIFPDFLSAWTALMQQKVDIIDFILPRDLALTRVDPAFQIYSYVSPFYYMVLYNLNDTLFSDKRIRQAFSCALDREETIRLALLGHGRVSTGPFEPDSWIYGDTGASSCSYDPRQAAEILTTAGWVDIDGDGLLEKDGRKLEFVLLLDNRDKVKERAALAIQQQFARLGVKMRAEIFDPLAFFTKLREGEFQAAFVQYNSGLDPDVVSRFWHSRAIGEFNFCAYQNHQMDRLIEEGRQTSDQDERRYIYQKIQSLLIQDCPATFLFFKEGSTVISSRVRGVQGFSPANIYSLVKEWYIPADVGDRPKTSSVLEGR